MTAEDHLCAKLAQTVNGYFMVLSALGQRTVIRHMATVSLQGCPNLEAGSIKKCQKTNFEVKRDMIKPIFTNE